MCGPSRRVARMRGVEFWVRVMAMKSETVEVGRDISI